MKLYYLFRYLLILIASFFFFSPTYALDNDMSVGMVITLQDKDLSLYQELGVKWLRLGSLPWEIIEPQQGRFDFDRLDELVNEAKSRGITLVVTINAISSWGSSGRIQKTGTYHSSSFPGDINAYKTFLTKLVTRYKDSIKYWQIGNEPNTPAFWSGTPKEYIELLKISYETIKKASPESQILTAGFACGISKPAKLTDALSRKMISFFEAVIDSQSFDIVDLHNYYLPDKPINNFTFEKYVNEFQAVMRAHGCTKPVWITEFGYSSEIKRKPGFNEDSQAQLLKKAVALSNRMGISKIFWLTMKDRQEGIFSHMGLISKDGTKKRAYFVFRQILNGLGDGWGNSASGNYVESIYFSSKTQDAYNLAVKGDYAYLVAARNFIVIDISDKKNPKLVFNFPSEKEMMDVFIDGNYAYVGVGERRYPEGGIRVFDILDPKNVKEIKNTLVLPEGPVGIFVRNNTAFIGDFSSGMIIVNMSDKANPQILSNYEIAWALDGSTYNELLALAKTDYPKFKQLLLAKYAPITFTSPELFDNIIQRMGLENFIKHLAISVKYGVEPHVWWLTVRGDYAYITLDAGGMDIVDISNLKNPVKVGNFKKGERGNEYFFNDIALSGDYAYAAVDAHGLLVIDISDPRNPREVKDVPAWSNTKWLESGGHMVRAIVDGDDLYLSAAEDGLYIYDISDKTNPTLIQKVDKSVENGKGVDWALDVQDGYVYTAYFNGCSNRNRCSPLNPNAKYNPTGGFEIFKIIKYPDKKL